MTDSYLGLVTRRGLESLVIETEHAELFVLRRARRRFSGDACCYWAVVDNTVAHQIMRHVRCRRFADALCRLRVDATHIGIVALSDNDDEYACHA
jgi:hypothetical protein